MKIPATPYEVIRKAILDRQSLSAVYENYVRHFSPHALGRSWTDVAMVVAYQYGGGRRGGLPPRGAWAIFEIDGLKGLWHNGDDWFSGPASGTPLGAFRSVDVTAVALE
jgi:hypothetical protein